MHFITASKIKYIYTGIRSNFNILVHNFEKIKIIKLTQDIMKNS